MARVIGMHQSSSPSLSSNNGVADKNIDDGNHIEVPLLPKYATASEGIEDENEKGVSFLKTCLNGLNALSGVGILSIPFALSRGGWLSLPFLVFVASLCCYTGLLLQRCMIANPSIRTYPDIAEHAFGYKGRMAVSVVFYLHLYLVAIDFLILEGDNLDKLLPNRGFNLGIVTLEGEKMFILVAALILLPTTWLRNLSVFSLISTGGIVASSIVMASVLWVALFDDVGFHERGSLFNLGGLPTSVSLYTFSCCAHVLFPTLFSSMENKRQFPKVLYICFISCTLSYGCTAVVGYLMYGESIQSQITLNMPRENIASYIAIGMTLMNPFAKYALYVTPMASAIEERLLFSRNTFARIITRTIIVISTALIAVSVPFFAYVMAFIGSSGGIVLSILLPCFCYLKIFEPTQRSKTEKVTVTAVIVIGIVVGIVGTYTSVRQIIETL